MTFPEKHLALFIPTLEGGGSERTFVNLAMGFVDAGYQVDFLLKQKTGEYLAQLPGAIRIIDLHASRMIATLPKVARYLRKEKPRALIAGLDLSNMIAVLSKYAAFSPVKTILTIRSVVSQDSKFFLPSRDLEQRMMGLVYPRADYIVAVSQAVAEDFSRFTGVETSRIKVIYNPTLTAEFYQKADQKIDHPWFQPGQLPVILAAGRLNQVKGFSTLIRAFKQIRQTQPARLVILGEGPLRGELEALIRENALEDNVQLPGFIQNPYPYMKNAGVFVLSSLHEASPNVLVEALACGCAVVSTDCPGGAAELIGGGQYGRLVPVGDVNAMSAAILAAMQDERHPAPTDWLQNFEPGTAIAQYLNLVEGLV